MNRDNIEYLVKNCLHKIDHEDDDVIVLYDHHLTSLYGYPHPYHYFLKDGEKILNLGRHRVSHHFYKFKREQAVALGKLREENIYPRHEFVWCYSNKVLVYDKQTNIYIAYLNIDCLGTNADRCYFLYLNSDIEQLKIQAHKFWSPDSPNYSRSIQETACNIVEGMISSRLKKNTQPIEEDWSMVYYTKNKWLKYTPDVNLLLTEHAKKEGCTSCLYCDFLKTR
jgi:hypothetical protein